MEFDKARVFTALNAEELNVGTRVLVADNIDLLKKKVSVYGIDKEKNEATEPATVVGIHAECVCKRFRVKFDDIDREYEYALAYVIPCVERPFNDLAELVSYWDMHYQDKKRPPYTLPFMWVVSDGGAHLLISGFRKSDESVKVGGHWYNLQYMFDNFTFEDGKQFGVLIK